MEKCYHEYLQKKKREEPSWVINFGMNCRYKIVFNARNCAKVVSLDHGVGN